MDKTAIKKFAVEARRSLIESIKLRAASLGISEKGVEDKLPISTSEVEYYKDEQNGITGKDIVKRQKLVAELNQRATKNDIATAFHDLVEEVAYTWFNRIIAIRFMEVNDYLPSRTRVLSSTENRNEPDIMIHALDIADDLGGFSAKEQDLINQALDTEQLTVLDDEYRMLFIKQANALNKNLPYLFETTNDYAELLFTPSYHDGVIQHLITDVSEDDFNVAVGGQVEIIGWLYQYYNTEPHNQVVNITGGPVKKADIPAATQLFTTDWVVKYMVDNSLGKFWLERHPDSQLKDYLRFLLPSDIEFVSDDESIEDVKIIDNAMGSGHILVYAFDVLMKIYAEQGYSSRDAATSILKNNLFGLEIDKRAYQLAYFALMMKARQFNRRALRAGSVTPNVFVFEDTDDISEEFMSRVDTEVQPELADIVERFSNARELGSIIHFDSKKYNFNELRLAVDSVQVDDLDLFSFQMMKEKLLRVLRIAEILCDRYEVVVTNPPYMNKMEPALKKYVKKYYADYSGDLFSIFIFSNSNLAKTGGYSAFMTPFVWMFIKTYEKLRKYLIENKKIDSLIQMEYSAFEEATVPINTFVLKNTRSEETGTYVKLSAFKGGMDVQKDRVLEAIANSSIDYLYRTNQANFAKIPGMPIAYWASESLIHDFEVGIPMDKVAAPRVGLQTADNNRFLREWYEVEHRRIKFDATSLKDALESGKEWFPYNKGGSYRKWYGNYDYVVNWQDDGHEIRNFKGPNGKVRSRPQNTNYYFREAITWSLITSGGFSMRFRSLGSIHDVSGMSAFSNNEDNLKLVLGIMNSPVGNYLTKILNPTINLQLGNFNSIPIIDQGIGAGIVKIDACINLSKKDWASTETSWDFTHHPLLTHIADDKQNEVNGKLKNAFGLWQDEAQNRFDQLKANEEELNRIFIDLYGLNDELTPDVADKDISVRLADEKRDIKSFLSYFVGVVFGRYSLDVKGLAYAGGDWDKGKYQSFVPNEDNILMLNDADYFGDSRDIINRLKEFLTVTLEAETVEENLSYIASVVGKKADSDEAAIRRYFVEDFFKDHKKIYQKRPIYWEFNSGRHNGFKALMYLHRYNVDELAMLRTNYLHPLQGKYELRIDQLTQLSGNETVASQKKRYEKELKHLEQQLIEIRKYDPLIQHIANQKIALDLDDGVIVNYDKVQSGSVILSKLK
ncbi:BREX-1 system adenine-specific DNA-methyltransferase PglX [Levilactobacillus koreensis]|uniref:BREX-1 system adenine-specific DNA-methyltransferase PglX n=1 Tax=Levilactobacillus koreensis TaxID=637971 RepID=UPI000704A568|nr:BREX-1 system adenine-specific DNA-methyltransferase PglX [Levilactobacillus koreensis]